MELKLLYTVENHGQITRSISITKSISHARIREEGVILLRFEVFWMQVGNLQYSIVRKVNLLRILAL